MFLTSKYAYSLYTNAAKLIPGGEGPGSVAS